MLQPATAASINCCISRTNGYFLAIVWIFKPVLMVIGFNLVSWSPAPYTWPSWRLPKRCIHLKYIFHTFWSVTRPTSLSRPLRPTFSALQQKAWVLTRNIRDKSFMVASPPVICCKTEHNHQGAPFGLPRLSKLVRRGWLEIAISTIFSAFLFSWRVITSFSIRELKVFSCLISSAVKPRLVTSVGLYHTYL